MVLSVIIARREMGAKLDNLIVGPTLDFQDVESVSPKA
jgi:hypothetical protein